MARNRSAKGIKIRTNNRQIQRIAMNLFYRRESPFSVTQFSRWLMDFCSSTLLHREFTEASRPPRHASEKRGKSGDARLLARKIDRYRERERERERGEWERSGEFQDDGVSRCGKFISTITGARRMAAYVR